MGRLVVRTEKAAPRDVEAGCRTSAAPNSGPSSRLPSTMAALELGLGAMLGEGADQREPQAAAERRQRDRRPCDVSPDGLDLLEWQDSIPPLKRDHFRVRAARSGKGTVSPNYLKA